MVSTTTPRIPQRSDTFPGAAPAREPCSSHSSLHTWNNDASLLDHEHSIARPSAAFRSSVNVYLLFELLSVNNLIWNRSHGASISPRSLRASLPNMNLSFWARAPERPFWNSDLSVWCVPCSFFLICHEMCCAREDVGVVTVVPTAGVLSQGTFGHQGTPGNWRDVFVCHTWGSAAGRDQGCCSHRPSTAN